MELPSPSKVCHAVAIYRSRGYQPLPSDPRPHSEGGRKKPLVKYAHLWESLADPATLDYVFFSLQPPCNIQVMLGRRWKLCVLDIDGPEAFGELAKWPKLPRSWVSYHGRGDKSKHVWFTTPPGDAPRPKRVLWRGEGEHTAIELLCDHSLIVAPPSLHTKTRAEYTFLAGESPRDRIIPAVCPDWLWRMPACSNSQIGYSNPPWVEPTLVQRKPTAPGNRVDYRDVLSVVPVADVAKGWGLRFAERIPTAAPWVAVHDFNREDRNPSAAFNLLTGRFWRPGMRPISLFELGVEMGHYADWRECCDALAEHYGVKHR